MATRKTIKITMPARRGRTAQKVASRKRVENESLNRRRDVAKAMLTRLEKVEDDMNGLRNIGQHVASKGRLADQDRKILMMIFADVAKSMEILRKRVIAVHDMTEE